MPAIAPKPKHISTNPPPRDIVDAYVREVSDRLAKSANGRAVVIPVGDESSPAWKVIVVADQSFSGNSPFGGAIGITLRSGDNLRDLGNNLRDGIQGHQFVFDTGGVKAEKILNNIALAACDRLEVGSLGSVQEIYTAAFRAALKTAKHRVAGTGQARR